MPAAVRSMPRHLFTGPSDVQEKPRSNTNRSSRSGSTATFCAAGQRDPSAGAGLPPQGDRAFDGPADLRCTTQDRAEVDLYEPRADLAVPALLQVRVRVPHGDP